MATAQDILNAGRQVDLARFPIWSGTKDSAFTAEQWIQRIQRAADAGTWTPKTTMSYVFNAMRGETLVWFDALPALGYDTENWNDFKEAFLKTYGSVKTVRTTALNVADIRQGNSEPAAQYIARVVKIINDIKEIAPAILPAPAEPFTEDVRAVAGFVALPNNVKAAQTQYLLQAGAMDAYNRVGVQLFIAGLKPALRTELMKAEPRNMREAFDAAVKEENILKEPKRHQHAANVSEVRTAEDDDDEDEDEEGGDDDGDEAEIAAITRKLKNLKKKFSKKKKSPGGKPANNRSQTKKDANKANGSNGSHNKEGCWFCGMKNHLQKNCFKRKSANAPMVDQHGQPYASGAGVNSLTAMQMMQLQQQHQQQQLQQQQREQLEQLAEKSPFPHLASIQYAQSEQGGGGGNSGWASNPYRSTGGGFENVPNGFPLNY
jgi:hypothetical protein